MNEKEITLLYKKAIETWGEPAQIIVAIEEMAELTLELSKNIDVPNIPNIDIITAISEGLRLLAKQIRKNQKYNLTDKTETYLYYPEMLNDELVDVTIMVEQLHTMFLTDEERKDRYNNKREEKLQRIKSKLTRDTL